MGGLLALLLLAACSQDTDTPGGEPLPEGMYPLALTAGGLEVTATPAKTGTRATVDNTWGEGDKVAVRVITEDLIDNYGVRQYSVDASGDLASSDPFYWQNGKVVFIDSWYPYSETCPKTWTVKADQSEWKDFQASDFLFATERTTFKEGKNGVKLEYRHLVSKIVVNILASDYLDGLFTPDEISVYLIGHSTEGNFVYGDPLGVEYGNTPTIEGTANSKNAITMYKLGSPMRDDVHTSFEAIVMPQAVNGQSIQVKVGDTIYKWDLQLPDNATSLQGGTVYTFNITVVAKGLNVSVNESIGWPSTGTSGSGSVILN